MLRMRPECREVALSFRKGGGRTVHTQATANKLCSEVILDLIFGNNAGLINKVGVEKH